MMRMKVLVVVLVSLVSGSSGSLGFGGDGMKVWRRDTNFWNVGNWEGLVDENCSRNIFSFPGWMDPSVVAFPSTFIGKQIILPVNGHFVFHSGLTTLSDSGTCQHGREVKFLRTTRADWFDPNNWGIRNGNRNRGGSSSSLSLLLFGKDSAIPHVERVPCQFDRVEFPKRSTFNLIISRKVKIGKFFLGDEEQNYTDIAIMMNTELGKLQFSKPKDVEFSLTGTECSDSDETCVCDNYESSTRQKICSLSECQSEEDECHNPIMPHGFCCPICGYHVKIKHSGGLKLTPIHQMLKQMEEAGKLGGVSVYISRHQKKGAHVIVVPMKNNTGPVPVILKMLAEIVSRIKSVPQVEEVTVNGSWENIPSDVDRLEGGGMNGGLITLIVILIISLLLSAACFIFFKKKGTLPSGLSLPTFSLPSIPAFPTMQMPNFTLPGRRGSTEAGGRTFGFARFTNERVSTVNLDRSTLERGEKVDDEAISSRDEGESKEKVTDASAQSGFTNVTYDIIGVSEGASTADSNPWEVSESSNKSGSYELLVDVGTDEPPPATSGPHESSLEVGSTATAATSASANKSQLLSGPPKPSRSAPVSAEEPIYDDVMEMTDDDTTAILGVGGKSTDRKEE